MIGAGCAGGEEESRRSFVVELRTQSASGQSGTAEIVELDDDRAKVTIEIVNPADEPQAAHIHRGTCREVGEAIYPLNDLEAGVSETTIPSYSKLRVGDWAVNVHASDVDYTETACGDVPQPTVTD